MPQTPSIGRKNVASNRLPSLHERRSRSITHQTAGTARNKNDLINTTSRIRCQSHAAQTNHCLYLFSQRAPEQTFRFALLQDSELPRLTNSIKRLVPVNPNLRLEDDYQTDEEATLKAQADARRDLRNAINHKLDKALRGESSCDEDPEFCQLETGPLAKRLRKRNAMSA